MTTALALTLLATGLLRGFLHALDPDHILTISALSAADSSENSARPLRYALIWSLGHSVVIMAVAALLLLTGQNLPTAISASAEIVVGAILMTIAISVFWSIYQALQGTERTIRSIRSPLSSSAPLMIGSIHGLAGSASLLALVPVAFLDLAPGLAFVIVFCVGVLAAMIGFSLVFERVHASVAAISPSHVWSFQAVIGAAAMGFGFFWILKGGGWLP